MGAAVIVANDQQPAIAESYVKNHDFVFISGFPQSGTSLIHQIFTLMHDFSTMVEKCTKISKGCVSWNYEGQWILQHYGKQKNLSSILNPGSMCTSSSSSRRGVFPRKSDDYNIALRNIVYSWESFWDLDKRFLIEKSPQSMLKINLLRETFHSARSIKFIVVIKV